MIHQTFAIDYDETFTSAPELWAMFIREAKHLRNKVYCVTSRRETDESVDQMNEVFSRLGCQMLIVFTSHSPKQYAMQQRGIKVDVWIDDDPKSIIFGI